MLSHVGVLVLLSSCCGGIEDAPSLRGVWVSCRCCEGATGDSSSTSRTSVVELPPAFPMGGKPITGRLPMCMCEDCYGSWGGLEKLLMHAFAVIHGIGEGGPGCPSVHTSSLPSYTWPFSLSGESIPIFLLGYKELLGIYSECSGADNKLFIQNHNESIHKFLKRHTVRKNIIILQCMVDHHGGQLQSVAPLTIAELS